MYLTIRIECRWILQSCDRLWLRFVLKGQTFTGAMYHAAFFFSVSRRLFSCKSEVIFEQEWLAAMHGPVSVWFTMDLLSQIASFKVSLPSITSLIKLHNTMQYQPSISCVIKKFIGTCIWGIECPLKDQAPYQIHSLSGDNCVGKSSWHRELPGMFWNISLVYKFVICCICSLVCNKICFIPSQTNVQLGDTNQS